MKIFISNIAAGLMHDVQCTPKKNEKYYQLQMGCILVADIIFCTSILQPAML